MVRRFITKIGPNGETQIKGKRMSLDQAASYFPVERQDQVRGISGRLSSIELSNPLKGRDGEPNGVTIRTKVSVPLFGRSGRVKLTRTIEG